MMDRINIWRYKYILNAKNTGEHINLLEANEETHYALGITRISGLYAPKIIIVARACFTCFPFDAHGQTAWIGGTYALRVTDILCVGGQTKCDKHTQTQKGA